MDTILPHIEKLFWLALVIEVVAIANMVGRYISGKVVGLQLSRIIFGLGQKYTFASKARGMPFLITSFPLGGRIVFTSDEFHNDPPEVEASPFQTIVSYLGGPVVCVFAAVMILSSSFVMFGDTSYTMQVVHTIKDSPAERAGFLRGDILLEVEGVAVTKFEMGQRLIARNPGKEISIRVERKKDYKEFSDYRELLTYLEKSYSDRNYIRIENTADELPSLFYAKDPALKYLEKVDISKIKVAISTAKEEFDVKVMPNEFGRIGIGIKPYSLDHLTVYPSPLRAIVLGFDYTRILVAEFILEVHNSLRNFFRRGHMPLELNMFKEMIQFVMDFSLLSGNEFLKLLAMICLAAGVLSMFPFPGSNAYIIFGLLFKIGVNRLFRVALGKDYDVIDENTQHYLKWLYNAGFALVLILFIIQSFPSIAG